ncbi:unnamed protein product [Thelazia callipaeda]|uniref:BTB domain-containing protein n=1 Tax=Thelazia callipaeda TaxID=103827 RepID=A0A0N5D2S1_THECL|nr:unnamed protein product [Thelazia callipaeda]
MCKYQINCLTIYCLEGSSGRGMTDFVSSLRSSDSWSTTEVRSLQHSHVWTIRGFSQCECRYLETSVKIKETVSVLRNSCRELILFFWEHNALNQLQPIPTSTLDGNHLTFRIRLHPQGNKESNKDFSFFQVFCNTNSAKYRAKFSVYNAKNEEAPTTVYTGTQQLHGYFEYIRRDILVSHIQPQDELQLVLCLTITFDTVTKSSQNPRQSCVPEARPAEIARDLEAIYKEGRLADFTVVASGRELSAHQIILSARSPVFAAMLEPHTEEYKNSRVVLSDIDFEVMQELLLYMYTGRSPNLSSMALDLLAAADRFQLPGLKEMADQVLRTGIVVDSACRYLVFADMHNARELKADAIKFIAQNSSAVISVRFHLLAFFESGMLYTDGWTELVKEHPTLITEIVAAISSIDSRSLSSNQSPIAEPIAKRARLNGGI